MKSEFDLDAAIAWAKNNSTSSKKVALSCSTVARHDSEWSKLNVIAPDDKAGLREAINAAKAFDARYKADSDILSVRAAGKNVGQGRIDYETGLLIQNSIFKLIKLSAIKALRKANGKKSQVREYLKSCYMLVPEGSSFIYKVEMDISDKKGGDLGGSCNRSINKHLATQLDQMMNFCHSYEDKEITSHEFIEHNFDLDLCEKINTLFHHDIENVEFSFDWSGKEPIEKNTPKFISFDQKARAVLSKTLKVMSTDTTEVQKKTIIYIEKISWPMNALSGKVHFRVTINNESHKSEKTVDSSEFERIKPLVKSSRMGSVSYITNEGVNGKRIEILSVDVDFDSYQNRELLAD